MPNHSPLLSVGIVVTVVLLTPLAATVTPCHTCRGPVHSWDHLPVFFHGSQSTTAPDGSFSDEAMQQLIRFPIVTIEKWQASNTSPYITEEDAWIAAAKKLKALKPDLSIIVWMDSIRIYTANRTLTPTATSACATGHFAPSDFLLTHENYLLHNASGSRAYDPWSGCNIYDHREAMVRDFWTEMCLNLTASGVIDGCGADAAWQINPAGNELSNDTITEWSNGHIQMMNQTQQALEQGLLVGKEPNELGYFVNGILQEGCPPGNDTINALRNVTARAKAMNKELVFECHNKNCDNPKNHTAPLCTDHVASFLIGAGPGSYWGIGAWNLPTGSNFSNHWIPEFFEPKLGAPLADGSYDEGTQTWTRKFASGTVVTYNLEDGGRIEWGEQ